MLLGVSFLGCRRQRFVLATKNHTAAPISPHPFCSAGCVMDMRHPDGLRVRNVYLPRGSLLVMEGAARYEWSHGIASRKTDMVCCLVCSLFECVLEQ